jgi:hypothetical protein
MWYVEGVGLVKTPRGITIDGVQHPRNIFTLWSREELAAVGIKPARIVSVDSTYYNTGALTWNTSGVEAVGTYATTEKDIVNLKEEMKRAVKGIVSSRLSDSDWMVIRAADGGTAVPEAWTTYRAALRTTSNTKEAEIDALADLGAVKAYRAHSVRYTRLTGTTDEEGVTTWDAPNIVSETTIDKVTWTEEGDHADSWPLAPDHIADPSFVSVVNA